MANALPWIVAVNMPPNLCQQDFESGVRPPGWSTSGNAPQYNFVPALQGNFSLGLTTAPDLASVKIAPVYELYIFFELLFTNNPVAGTPHIMELYVPGFFNSATVINELTLKLSAGTIGVDDNTVNQAFTVSTLSINTLYYVWVHYIAGTGANSFASVAFSTTLSEPTSGNNFASFSNGSDTRPIEAIMFRGDAATTTVIDKVAAATMDIMASGW